jgi:hypothetical protein
VSTPSYGSGAAGAKPAVKPRSVPPRVAGKPGRSVTGNTDGDVVVIDRMSIGDAPSLWMVTPTSGALSPTRVSAKSIGFGVTEMIESEPMQLPPMHSSVAVQALASSQVVPLGSN